MHQTVVRPVLGTITQILANPHSVFLFICLFLAADRPMFNRAASHTTHRELQASSTSSSKSAIL